MSTDRPRVTIPSSHAHLSDNRFSRLIPSQRIANVDTFELEEGTVLQNVQVAFKTWGKLNARRDNAMVICHALTGSADVEDWWGPMMGRGLAFDPSRYFIFCANVLGSPYGTTSPVTLNPATGERWGPEFPLATIRDDVRLHRLILDHLGVSSVAAVIGGSMGGMQVLEWAMLHGKSYVRNIVPIATSPHHSAWGISWGEAQRQAIYSDPSYEEGYYDDDKPPSIGLAAARMAALLTYRSRDSFESRFGRREMESRVPSPTGVLASATSLANSSSGSDSGRERAREAHNDGYRIPPSGSSRRKGSSSSLASLGGSSGSAPTVPASPHVPAPASPSLTGNPGSLTGAAKRPFIYTAQSYLRYQGDKFTSRFDANCYIAIGRKMDSHDVCRGRMPESTDASLSSWHPLNEAPPHTLVLAISSDALFTLDEQRTMVSHLPDARLVVVESPEGHDGFLLEFEQINKHILDHLKQRLPEIYAVEPLVEEDETGEDEADGVKKIQKDSVFGEAEADVTAW